MTAKSNIGDHDTPTQSPQQDDGAGLHCTCRGPSQGNMIACDNSDCPIQWYHYECVGLKRAPRGKWFCPDCKEAQAPRKNKRKGKGKGK